MPIDTIVLHDAGTRSAEDAIRRLRDPAAHVSAHYLIDQDGGVLRLVEERRRAWHAGVSYWRGMTALDGRSIGIAIANPGDAWGDRPFGALQMAALCDLCLDILSRHPIPTRNIVARGDVAPEREQSAGELFDWEGLAANGVGLWPEGMPDFGAGGVRTDAASLREVRAALAAIGYGVAPEGAADAALGAVLRAFQRHWRPEAVTGAADAGTVARIMAVARMAEASA